MFGDIPNYEHCLICVMRKGIEFLNLWSVISAEYCYFNFFSNSKEWRKYDRKLSSQFKRTIIGGSLISESSYLMTKARRMKDKLGLRKMPFGCAELIKYLIENGIESKKVKSFWRVWNNKLGYWKSTTNIQNLQIFNF